MPAPARTRLLGLRPLTAQPQAVERGQEGGSAPFPVCAHRALCSSFAYDENGNRTMMQSPTGTVYWTYDELDRMISEEEI